MMRSLLVLLLTIAASALAQECPSDYVEYFSKRNPPFSPGVYEYPYQRPSQDCRTYNVDEIEKVIGRDMNKSISDPDLYRLFANTWPNTVDTTVKWTGYSDDNPDEEVSHRC